MNITSGKLTKSYNKPYIFLKIMVRTLLFGTAFTKMAIITRLKLALNMVIFSILLFKVIPESWTGKLFSTCKTCKNIQFRRFSFRLIAIHPWFTSDLIAKFENEYNHVFYKYVQKYMEKGTF
jgi:hypothetical protein